MFEYSKIEEDKIGNIIKVICTLVERHQLEASLASS